MPLLVNLRHLEREPQVLQGEIPVEDLDVGNWDELIQTPLPLKFDLTTQLVGRGLLVQGRLELPLACECARCLQPFRMAVQIEQWAVLLPLEGQDKVLVINDCVDLTPWIREDILLAFPLHPVCRPECGGLPEAKASAWSAVLGPGPELPGDSAWAALDKLKF
jgi:uncharacterized protein